MATPIRSRDTDVEQYVLREALAGEPFRFDFFQAVRLLESLASGASRVGEFVAPKSEVVRFRAHQSMSFPASAIQSLEMHAGPPSEMSVNFMGMTGPSGLLPLYYTEYVLERLRKKDAAFQEFLDIFNHRAISLFYRAWRKYRYGSDAGVLKEDSLTTPLLAVIGLGAPQLRDRQSVPDSALMYYAGLVGQQPHSAIALERVVSDYFDVPVAVKQFAGCWIKLGRESVTRLDESSEVLGCGAILGDEVWHLQSLVRVVIGPLPLKRYLDFLPCGTAWEPLKGILRFYCNQQVEFEVQRILQKDDTPRVMLGERGESAPRLGWVTWLRKVPLAHDPDEMISKIS